LNNNVTCITTRDVILKTSYPNHQLDAIAHSPKAPTVGTFLVS